jgi:hypothetical protein
MTLGCSTAAHPTSSPWAWRCRLAGASRCWPGPPKRARRSSRTTTTASSAFAGHPIEPLHRLHRDGRVIYLGPFSKSLLPTLRLGFLVTPPSLRRALRAAKFLSDWHTSLPPQAALARFIDQGQLARHVHKMRNVYRRVTSASPRYWGVTSRVCCSRSLRGRPAPERDLPGRHCPGHVERAACPSVLHLLISSVGPHRGPGPTGPGDRLRRHSAGADRRRPPPTPSLPRALSMRPAPPDATPDPEAPGRARGPDRRREKLNR